MGGLYMTLWLWSVGTGNNYMKIYTREWVWVQAYTREWVYTLREKKSCLMHFY